MTLINWPRRATSACTYRVAVRQRRPHGMFDALDMALSGHRWSWWCACDADRHHSYTHRSALDEALAHLANEHHELPRRRRRPR